MGINLVDRTTTKRIGNCMKYCGSCYYEDKIYPFGFCRRCWIKAGRPQLMSGEKVA